MGREDLVGGTEGPNGQRRSAQTSGHSSPPDQTSEEPPDRSVDSQELHEAQRGRIAELSREVGGLREELSTDGILSEALYDHANRLRNGERPPANAHIARAARPLPESEARTGRVAQLWASISVAVVLLTLTGILFYQSQHLLFALVFAIAVLAFVEAGFRKRLDRFMVSANIGLSVVGAFVLLDRYFWQIIVLSVLAMGLYILWENLRGLGR